MKWNHDTWRTDRPVSDTGLPKRILEKLARMCFVTTMDDLRQMTSDDVVGLQLKPDDRRLLEESIAEALRREQ